jgi:hypothetical protein
MLATLKFQGVPSFVTDAEFARALAVDGCLETRLLGRSPDGAQVAAADFRDRAAADRALGHFQGFRGLGGPGLHVEPSPYNLSQLAGGGGGAKRPYDGGDAGPHKMARAEGGDPPELLIPQELLQGLSSGVLSGLLHQGQAPGGAPADPRQRPGAGAPAPYQPDLAAPYQPEPAQQQQQQQHAPLTQPGGYGQAAAYAPPPAAGAYAAAPPAAQPYYPPPAAAAPSQAYAPAPMHVAPPPTQYQQPQQPAYAPPSQQQQPYGGAPPAQPQYPPPAQYAPPAPAPGAYGAAAPAPLPHDACPTLYIDGLPQDATKRELGHLARLLPGYQGMRLVVKDSKKYAGEKLVMAFYEFVDASAAAAAMARLQGYVFDADDPAEWRLHVKFARPPDNPRAALAAALARGGAAGQSHLHPGGPRGGGGGGSGYGPPGGPHGGGGPEYGYRPGTGPGGFDRRDEFDRRDPRDPRGGEGRRGEAPRDAPRDRGGPRDARGEPSARPCSFMVNGQCTRDLVEGPGSCPFRHLGADVQQRGRQFDPQMRQRGR